MVLEQSLILPLAKGVGRLKKGLYALKDIWWCFWELKIRAIRTLCVNRRMELSHGFLTRVCDGALSEVQGSSVFSLRSLDMP